MTILLVFLAVYYGIVIFSYWLPLWAVRTRPAPSLPPDIPASTELPRLVVIAPCRQASASIPGMVTSIKTQDYPPDRFRLILLIDSDDSTDPAPAIARAAGAEVYERHDPAIKTKGAALNELFQTRLKNEPWDAVVVLDIDVRVNPHFLNRVAAYLAQGASVIQGAQISKNADESPISRINHAAQILAQIAQSGRTRLGLWAILCGGCMVFNRKSLEQLDWQTSTGDRLSDDGELNLRCAMLDIPLMYGRDLELLNDLPANIQSTRLQRKRWFASYAQLSRYIVPLTWRGLTGHFLAFEKFAAVMLCPSSSVAFVLGILAVLVFGVMSVIDPSWIRWFTLALLLLIGHSSYYYVALRTGDGLLGWQEFKKLPSFMRMRFRSMLDGMILAHRTNASRYTVPSRPKEDR